MIKIVALISVLILSACDCTGECLMRESGQPIQVSDMDGIKLYKKYDDGEWIYYSVDAKKVHWTTQYQCGGYFIQAGKVQVWNPTYCDKNHDTIGDIK